MILSPFRFAGAKNKLLPILQEYLAPILQNGDSYFEPFIGGGSVGLYVAAQYPNIKLFFNDKDEWVSSFWSVVAGEESTFKELLNLVNTPVSIDKFYQLSETPPITIVDKAYRAIFYNRTCFSGIFKRDVNGKIKSTPIGGKLQQSKYKVDCRFNAKKISDKLIKCHHLLKNRTTVSNENVVNFINKCNGPIYLDPPYFVKASMLYHEYMSNDEHIQLSQLLQQKKQWVLSYDDCSEIRQLYGNSNIIDLKARYCINGKKDSWIFKNELIIIPK